MKELFFDNRIAGLIVRFLQESITEAEYQELQAWIAESDRRKQLFGELTSVEKLPAEVAHFLDARERVLAKIYTEAPDAKKMQPIHQRSHWMPWIAAASIIAIALTGYWLLFLKKSDEKLATTVKKPATNDVAPGRDGGILTLSDGTTIVIDDVQNGNIANQGNVTITKEGGKLIYKALQADRSNLAYNTLTAPRGRTYRVELPDGSIVWLNAASSIHYPVVFGNNERLVKMTGEGYFEVAKESSRKFKVIAGSMSAEVLGTSFNINSYEDESDQKVTLVEGSIKVNAENSGKPNSAILKPGH